MSKVQRSIAAMAVVVGMVAASVLAVRASYGAFRHGYSVTGEFDRVSYGVGSGTQVEYRGIAVGRVESVHLIDHRAELRLSINKGFRIPATADAVIRPRSIFGDPYIDLDFSQDAPGPYLAAGARLPKTGVDSETGDLIASAVPLLEKINGQDLATIIHELSLAGANEGDRIRSSIENGTQLADLYATTIQDQLVALDSFAQFQSTLAPTGPSFDAIAANTNVALPTLNAAEADFQRALDALTPFANKLATFIAQERPDIGRMLDQGDNVVRLLTAREPQIEQVVTGLANYVFKFAAGRGPETLPNGTKFAYFKNFILFSDVNALICGILVQGGPATAPVVQALSQAGAPLDCSTTPTSPPAAASQVQTAARSLSDGVQSAIGAPQPPQPLTVQSLVDHILGKS